MSNMAESHLVVVEGSQLEVLENSPQFVIEGTFLGGSLSAQGSHQVVLELHPKASVAMNLHCHLEHEQECQDAYHLGTPRVGLGGHWLPTHTILESIEPYMPHLAHEPRCLHQSSTPQYKCHIVPPLYYPIAQ